MNKFFYIWVLLSFILTASIQPASAKLNLFEKPRYIPNVSFYGDSGKAYKLSDFREDLLMAVIWSRFCGPCLTELKALNTFAKKTFAHGIRVILISPEKEFRTPDQRRNFLKRFGATDIVSYNDRRSQFSRGLGIMVTPTTILVNKHGQEIGQITGAVEWDNPKVIKYLLKLKDKLK